MAQALYRKYRSKSLDQVVGQDHITKILSRAIKQGRIAHAYLFTGPRGVGKTSVARILAYEINKFKYDETTNHLDIIEIDAASNNGVEDIRSLREKAQIAPVAAAKKIYIIDEVHMLSNSAFNALLKTLEEPPEHVVFILATTDADKLPDTIISRTQRFNFHRAQPDDIEKHLAELAKSEKIDIETDAIAMLAVRADGSFRDAVGLLDQMAGLASSSDMTITADLVEASLGLAPLQSIEDLIDCVKRSDLSRLVTTLDSLEQSGVQTSILLEQLVAAARLSAAKSDIYIALLSALLEVASSPYPQHKLLTALASCMKPRRQSTAALAVSNATVTLPNPVDELTAKAVEPKPRETMVQEIAPVQIDDAETPTTQPTTKKSVDIESIDWNELIQYTKKNYVAIYSVLNKCSYQLADGTLNIYTSSAFYKKKLDDPKYRTSLHKSLEAIGVPEIDIETIPTPAPIKDGTAAAVAAIMGGGEEVTI
ncbi:MAG: DNA polymerase III subunit gamma/tau [bacterium]|nr:DNA polymerase III subunit gamma/tau [bacterium]MDN5835054.1 DNA polymerase III subunit gamma/tau [bacterium]